MELYYLDLALPWSGLQEEDRRFRLILLSTLIAFVALGGVAASLSVPSMQGITEDNLPPRIAYIIDTPGAFRPSSARAEQSGQAPRRLTNPPSDAAEAGATGARPQAAETRPTARQMAASAGVLALSDALRDLQEAAPRVAAASPVHGRRSTGERTDSTARSVLLAGLSQGSGGIDGEVSEHGEVLGLPAPGLSGEAGLGGNLQGSLGAPGAPSRGQERAGKQRKMGRSQEEIQEILDRNKSRMYALYNRELRRNPALQGKVVVSITIAPSGAVTDCTMVYSELDATSLERKLIVLIKRIDFGDKPGVPVVTTKVPIEFFPA